jgi:hypothetical protein
MPMPLGVLTTVLLFRTESHNLCSEIVSIRQKGVLYATPRALISTGQPGGKQIAKLVKKTTILT